MKLNETKKRLRIGTIALWIIFGITTITMIALIIGVVFTIYEFWIPLIPIGILLILASTATILDIKSESKVKVGIVAL
jgi:CHASE2 domain-containing sensor protein